MPKKCHSLQQDILSYLKSVFPKTALWREIKATVSPNHESKYKNNQSFRTAFSAHLSILVRDDLVKQVGDQYGLPKANFKATKLSSGFSKQKLKEQFLKALSDVTAERIEGDVYTAYKMLDGLIGLAPPEWRKLMVPIWNEAHKAYEEETRFSHPIDHMKKTYTFVRFCEQKFASIIYEN